MKEIDLADLRGFEQAKELTISLLKKCLVKYKFKNWISHGTNPLLIGQPVTIEQKQKRAEEIADKLSSNNIWKCHSRPINIETLENDLKLIIEDYSNDNHRKSLIGDYYELMSNYVINKNFTIFIQTRNYII